MSPGKEVERLLLPSFPRRAPHIHTQETKSWTESQGQEGDPLGVPWGGHQAENPPWPQTMIYISNFLRDYIFLPSDVHLVLFDQDKLKHNGIQMGER